VGPARLATFGIGICNRLPLQDIPAQILVLHDVRQLLVHVSGINLHRFLLQVRRFKLQLIQHFFKNRVQTPRANVFR
jgi:alpha-galactosidase/6-phospho-beta-glucosidase family protein